MVGVLWGLIALVVLVLIACVVNDVRLNRHIRKTDAFAEKTKDSFIVMGKATIKYAEVTEEAICNLADDVRNATNLTILNTEVTDRLSEKVEAQDKLLLREIYRARFADGTFKNAVETPVPKQVSAGVTRRKKHNLGRKKK